VAGSAIRHGNCGSCLDARHVATRRPIKIPVIWPIQLLKKNESVRFIFVGYTGLTRISNGALERGWPGFEIETRLSLNADNLSPSAGGFSECESFAIVR